MPKTRAQKEATVKQLTDAFKTMKSVVFVNFDGVKVKQADALRRECRQNDVRMIVAKKSLLRIVFKNTKLDKLSDYDFAGGIASFFSFGEEVAAASLVYKFGKISPGLQMLGGIIEGRYYDQEDVQRFAVLPAKDELIGQVVGTIASPLTYLIGAVSGTMRQFITVLGNIRESK